MKVLQDNKINGNYAMLSRLNIQNEQEWYRLNTNPTLEDFYQKKFDANKKFRNDNIVAINEMNKNYTGFYDEWLVPNGKGGYKMVQKAQSQDKDKDKDGNDVPDVMIDTADPELKEGLDRDAFNKAHMALNNTPVIIKY